MTFDLLKAIIFLPQNLIILAFLKISDYIKKNYNYYKI